MAILTGTKTLNLVIGGFSYSEWTSAIATKSMDDITGSFTAHVTIESKFNPDDWPIKFGDAFKLQTNGETILDGWVEDFDVAYDSIGHSIIIAGRDKTNDLVDCVLIDEDKEWVSGSLVSSIIEDLAGIFNLSVAFTGFALAGASTPIQYYFAVNEGETVMQAIIRLCNMHGLRPLSMGDGKLTIATTGVTPSIDGLKRGDNILKGRFKGSNKNRFSDYACKGYGYMTDEKEPEDYIQPKGETTDSVIKRYRPFLIQAEDFSDLDSNDRRAKWESVLRAGKSRSYEFVVQGWTMSNFKPWQINTLVPVDDPTLGLNGVFLIYKLDFRLDPKKGSTTTIHVVDAGKYDAEAAVSRIKSEFDE